MLLVTLVIIAGGFLSACGRIQQNQSQTTPGNFQLDMVIEPNQPAAGAATLIFTLTDENGQPVDDATLEVEGNMTHAGMLPVLAQVAGGEAGRYVVPFEWTMGGDWIVTVKVSLATGQIFSRQFPVSVQ